MKGIPPKLEAGKHVVKCSTGDYYLVVENEEYGISGIGLGFKSFASQLTFDSCMRLHVTEVHKITCIHRCLVRYEFDESTLIWKRDNEAQKQYEQIQEQIRVLQKQAEDFYNEHLAID